jgi:iron(III) transport system ATP-binding protein
MARAGTLSLDNVTKEFKTPEGRLVTAVDAATLNIAPGEFLTLLGPSGCGKTTTLRMIAGFEYPTRGRIVLDGRDIAMVQPDKREMAMVFQSYALFPHLTVFENVAYGLRIRNVKAETLREKVATTLAMVGLEGKDRRRPSELSGGQQQRVALARAMAIEPRVLLFDEPLSNLDAKLRVSLRVEIRQLQKRLGITSIYVTHDQSEAMSLSDRIVVMSHGKIMQVDEPREIYLHPNNPFVADFIGQANFLDGVANRAADGMAEVAVQGQVVNVPCQVALKPGPCKLVVRPETIKLGVDGTFAGRVKTVSYMGSTVEYALESMGKIINVVDHDATWQRVFNEDDEVRWTFRADRSYAMG